MFLLPKRNSGCRIHSVQLAGMSAIILENQILRITVLLDKGADIIEFLHKPSDTDWMGISPMGLRNPKHLTVTTTGSNGNLIDSYEGGWQDVFPNGGDACVVNGIEYGQHGELALLSWDCQVLKDDPEQVCVLLKTETIRTPFLIEKKLTLCSNESVLKIEESITNKGRETLPIMWGQHPAFGAPAINEECIINLPKGMVHTKEGLLKLAGSVPSTHWPISPDNREDLSRVLPPDTGRERMYFITDTEQPWYTITNPRNNTCFGLGWSAETYPYLWYWHNSGSKGYPWFGRAYLLALEPFTSPVPQLSQARESGYAVNIKPGESVYSWITAVATQGRRITEIGRMGIHYE